MNLGQIAQILVALFVLVAGLSTLLLQMNISAGAGQLALASGVLGLLGGVLWLFGLVTTGKGGKK